jgi:hypothetical protein
MMRRLLQALLCALALCTIGAGHAFVDLGASGAKCDGQTDDSAAVAQAVATAQVQRVPIHVPAGTCRYSSTITLTQLVPLVGEGRAVSRLLYCGAGDAVLVLPPAGDGDLNRGHLVRDLSIAPCVPNGGQYGVHVRLPLGSQYAEFAWNRLNIGAFGARGLWLDNLAANQDGFFNGAVRDSTIANGILASGIGDSIAFQSVNVTGHNNVDLSSVQGARLVTWTGGQITTDAGWLILRGLDGFRMRDTWLEYQGAGPAGVDSMVQVLGTVAAIFEGLTVNVGNAQPAQVFALVGASDTRITNSDFAFSGQAAQVYGTSTTVRTTVSGCTFGVPPVKPRIVLQGS